jgi:hypothetical protein
VSTDDIDDLLDAGDPFDDPLWQRAADIAGALPRPADGYVTCPMAWLARVRQAVTSVDQLLVAQLLYRQCLIQRTRTVSLSNHDLKALGIGRNIKYRTLAYLKEVGAVTTEAGNGRAIRVTLSWFP